MKYLTFLVFISLISTSSFADEIMNCKINENFTSSYKLEENLFSDNKIFKKLGTKWVEQCPCHKVKNKTVKCNQAENKKCIKNDFGDFQVDENVESLIIVIDFETQLLKLQENYFAKTIELKCNLVKS